MDIQKAVKKENKGSSKEDIEKKIRSEYKKLYKKDADLYYNTGKNAYNWTMNNSKAVYGAGLVGVTGYTLASKNNPNSPQNQYKYYANKLIERS